MRAELFRLIGSFAEHTTHVVQRSTDEAVEFEIATGTTAGESPYLPHGTSADPYLVGTVTAVGSRVRP